MNKNNTNYPEELYKELKELYINDKDYIKENLFEYQRYVYNYMVNTNNRGILLFHAVGTGKTITSISIAEEFRKLNKEIIIISSKSLQSNYKKEIETYNKKLNENISENEIENIINDYKFVTSNSKNMISSLNTNLDNVLNNVTKVNLEDKIIIIDEAHNLFNSISNGSKIANEFYDLVMNTKKIKLIFLSGTPIINDPFEISIAFNLLYGPIKFEDKTIKTRIKPYNTILPEYYTDFQKYFVDQYTNSIKNENKFKNRIYGLVSYYGDMYFHKLDSVKNEINSIKSKENFPDRLPIKIEVIEMSQMQNIEYSKARDTEKKENTKFGGQIVREKNLVSTSYRIKSRQLSNIFISHDKQLTKENFKHYSPKIYSIFQNLQQYKNSISLVYSTFLDYGIYSMVKLLELTDYKLYNKETYNKDTKYYAIFSGEQSIEEKNEILKTVNSEDNKNGELINILLISKSGAEGLDLKNIRSVHIMEPYWNYSLIEQIIARAVRYKSHILLDKKDQNVQTYIYLSDYNKLYLEKQKEKIKENKKDQVNKKSKDDLIEMTTDITLFKNAVKNQDLIYKFLKCIASVSIECKFFNNKNVNYKCFGCLNNNKHLYVEDIHKDMIVSNNCIQTETIKAEEIIIDKKKYYYTNLNNNLKIFEFNDLLNGYKEINDENLKSLLSKKIKDN
jgi:hypothetical protein